MRAWKVLAITVLLTAGLIALVVGLRAWSGRLMTQYWLDRLDTVSDDRATPLLEQIAALDEPGIPILVAALGSPRAAVARAAAEVLAEQLHRWQNPPSPAGLRKQMTLVTALAERAADFGPLARDAAARLATRVLLVLPADNVADRGQLIAACEKVLQFRGAGEVPVESGQASSAPAEFGMNSQAAMLRPDDRVQRRREPLPSADLVPVLARLPGGGLPVDLFKPAAAERPPRLLHQPADSQPLETGQGSTAETAVVRPMSITQPDDASRGIAAAQRASALVRADTIELMRQLQSRDESAVAAARSELIRRKFTPAHLELARQLFHADPEIRKRLARALPETPGIDAVPWLLTLGHDPEADVRLVAVALLATTADPAALEQAEAIARNDPDPRVQQLAERLGRQLKGP